VCAFCGDGNEHIDLPVPAILKPVELWTGKQLFRVLLRPNEASPVIVSLDVCEKNYDVPLDLKHMDPDDGYVCFRNSELLSGNLCKRTLGDGGRNNIFYALARDYGADVSAKCMLRLAKGTSRWLQNVGFTIGIDDVTQTERLIAIKKAAMGKARAESNDVITDWKKGSLTADAGMDGEGTMESSINGILSGVRKQMGTACLQVRSAVYFPFPPFSPFFPSCLLSSLLPPPH
jgi:DNA-directed RNA polymerase III subunit RPC1